MLKILSEQWRVLENFRQLADCTFTIALVLIPSRIVLQNMRERSSLLILPAMDAVLSLEAVRTIYVCRP